MIAAHHVQPGTYLRVTARGAASAGLYPHRTEDLVVDADSIARVQGRHVAWLGNAGPPASATLMDAFEGHLRDHGMWAGATKGVHVAEGVRIRSLSAVNLRCSRLGFVEDEYRGKKKLRATLEDGNERYRLPVVSHALLERYRAGGVDAVAESMPAAGNIHVRIGLARAFRIQPGKCFRNGEWSTVVTMADRQPTDVQPDCVFTIGHSTHSFDAFAGLLETHCITAVADVRSAPYSRYLPQFSQEALKQSLRGLGIHYVFLGRELGGRPQDRTLYRDGVADYERMATARTFVQGIERVIEGAKKYRVGLMCSEHDPLDCHRCLLVSRSLVERCVVVRHILTDGSTKTQEEIEERLLELAHRASEDLFVSRDERLVSAYRERARKVAYSEEASAHDA